MIVHVCTRGHVDMHTQWLSNWLTRVYLICPISKHMCTNTHTHLSDYVSGKRGKTKPFFMVAIKEEDK